MLDFVEAGGGHLCAPGLERPEASISVARPTLAILTARVRAEENAPRPERREELAKDPRQLAAGDVEERGVSSSRPFDPLPTRTRGPSLWQTPGSRIDRGMRTAVVEAQGTAQIDGWVVRATSDPEPLRLDMACRIL